MDGLPGLADLFDCKNGFVKNEIATDFFFRDGKKKFVEKRILTILFFQNGKGHRKNR